MLRSLLPTVLFDGCFMSMDVSAVMRINAICEINSYTFSIMNIFHGVIFVPRNWVLQYTAIYLCIHQQNSWIWVKMSAFQAVFPCDHASRFG